VETPLKTYKMERNAVSLRDIDTSDRCWRWWFEDERKIQIKIAFLSDLKLERKSGRHCAIFASCNRACKRPLTRLENEKKTEFNWCYNKRKKSLLKRLMNRQESYQQVLATIKTEEREKKVFARITGYKTFFVVLR